MMDRKQELLDELVRARSEVLAEVSALRPQQWDQPTSNEGWSAKDTLAHLASIESRLRSMWQHALDGREWGADEPDLNAYNARCVEERRAWSAKEVIAELSRTGEETQTFVERLRPEDLGRQWKHPTRGEVSLESLIRIIPRHLRAHAEEIKAATSR